MKTFHALAMWPLRAKLLTIAGLSALAIAGALLGPPDMFMFLVIAGLGMAVSAIGGYWLGARWFLVPLVVMGVEIVIGVPATLLDPTAGETPIGVVLEAPFWTGLPVFVGALVGGIVRLVVERFQGKPRQIARSSDANRRHPECLGPAPGSNQHRGSSARREQNPS
jgi:hypothetical protein